ncbi:nitronate monooxygenase [Tistlia consotensis]|uniref:Nitronate monooxygenase n=1 Tax=Tistlia consotensis USBA 355 TaxID=560819 RepID=A0A1Y6BDM3_9PROT|nr:nitronate monooxygenase family protein [Tistlia consotensis]SMF04610.1 nitronate monooxygenase [Tistlia consotensis USBA 355]SNR54636.1 nitronate monooxygenase [Tistlia consotensis]
MPLPPTLTGRLKAPVVAAPMFLVSGPDLVVETCRAGLLGTFPALNQRTTEGYADWLAEIGERLAASAAAGEAPAPFGVNLVVHRSNKRLEADLAATVAAEVPLVVTSLGLMPEVIQAIQGYGGVIFHDVINLRHGAKAAAAGVDGIIAICAGAGGHAGALSPFAALAELRRLFDGPLILGGVMSDGRQVAAARLMGADLAYLGTRIIATRESLAPEAQKRMILEAHADDIVYTPAVSSVAGNFLRPSMLAAGLDPDDLRPRPEIDFGTREIKAWKQVWAAGQGVGSIDDLPSAAELCERLIRDYRTALDDRAALAAGLAG